MSESFPGRNDFAIYFLGWNQDKTQIQMRMNVSARTLSIDPDQIDLNASGDYRFKLDNGLLLYSADTQSTFTLIKSNREIKYFFKDKL